MPQQEPKADWFAWTLHFVVGLVVGALIIWWVLSRRGRGWVIDRDLLLEALIGGALLAAGVASRWGDRFWAGDSYRMIPPNEIEQSLLSLRISLTAITLGLGLLAYVLLTQYRVL